MSIYRDRGKFSSKLLVLTLYTTTILHGAYSLAISDEAKELSANYFMADGSRTNDLEEAANSWRQDPEFKKNWGLGAIRAEYAYAAGVTGKGVNVGVIDTGIDKNHLEFQGPGKLSGITVSGTRTADDINFYGPRKGDQFHLIGDDPLNSTYGSMGGPLDHGTHVGGTIAAARDQKRHDGCSL